MKPRAGAWIPSLPATRVADEEDVVGQLAWPGDRGEEDRSRRARAIAGLERLVRLGLPFREVAGGRRFDPYEVFFFMRWAHRRFGDPLWEESLREARGYACEYRPAAARPARFEISLEREAALEPRRPGSLFRAHLLCPTDDGGQREVTVRPMRRAGVRYQRSGNVLDARGAVPAAAPRLARLGMKISLRVGWRGEAIEPRRVEPFRAVEPADLPFLAAAEGPIRATQRIRRLSAELAGDVRTPWEAVRRFWRFLFANVAVGRIHPHVLSAGDPLSSVLDLGRSDCYYGSALLAALCRARGIPARLVSGYFLYRRLQTDHWWLEILVPPYGWVPCDLWSWILADGDIDSEWSGFFLGRVDPRLVVERLPRESLILDHPSSRPAYTLQRPCRRGGDPGVEIVVRDLASNAPIRRDRICVRALD